MKENSRVARLHLSRCHYNPRRRGKRGTRREAYCDCLHCLSKAHSNRALTLTIPEGDHHRSRSQGQARQVRHHHPRPPPAQGGGRALYRGGSLDSATREVNLPTQLGTLTPSTSYTPPTWEICTRNLLLATPPIPTTLPTNPLP